MHQKLHKKLTRLKKSSRAKVASLFQNERVDALVKSGVKTKELIKNASDRVLIATSIPAPEDDFDQKLNALIMLILIISVVLAFFQWRYWRTFLVIALLLVLMLFLFHSDDDEEVIENFHENPDDFTFYGNKVEPLENCYTHVKAPAMNNSEQVSTSASAVSTISTVVVKPSVRPVRPTQPTQPAQPTTQPSQPTQPTTQPIQPAQSTQQVGIGKNKKFVPNRGPRKTAYELQKEAYEPYHNVDYVERDRQNFINGII
jgi:Ca2+/Na+ antiporter